MKRSTSLSVILALVLPAVVGMLLLWSLSARADHLTKVPAAVVNADEMVTGPDGQLIYGGRLVASELTAPATVEDSSLGFVLTDAEDAQAGLADGSYFAVVTIPESFSANLATMSSEAPVQASIQVQSNDASSALLSTLAEQLGDVAARAINRQVTTEFVSGMLAGTTQLSAQLGEAADGASQLASGALEYTGGVAQISDGAGQLADGLGTAASGAQELAGGVQELAAGASELSVGAAQSATGASQLSSGTAQLSEGAAQLSGGAAQLAAGMPQLTTGASELAGGLQQLSAGVDPLAAGAAEASQGAAQLAEGIGELATGAHTLVTGLTTIQDGLLVLQSQTAPLPAQVGALNTGAQEVAGGMQLFADGLAAGGSNEVLAQFLTQVGMDCMVTPAAHCAQLPAVQQSLEEQAIQMAGAAAQAQELATGAAGIADGTAALLGDGSEANPGLTALAAGIDQLLTGYQSGNPATGEPGVVVGTQKLADGLTEIAGHADLMAHGDGTAANPGLAGLAGGLAQLAGSTPELISGAQQLATGTQELAGGVNELATGAAGVASGAAGVHSGATDLSGGLGQLAAGTSELTTGAASAAAGAGQLAAGVGESANGAGELAGGLTELDAGSAELVGGADELASGLHEGVAQIPTYSQAQVATIASVAVQPVTVQTSKLVSATGGTAVAGLVLAIGLWLGAFAAYLVLEAVPRRALAAPVSPLRTAMVGLRNGLALAVVQGVIAGVALPLFDVVPVHPIAAAAVAVLAALSFVAVHQGVVAAFGRRIGAIISVLLLVVQLAALGVVIPAQTAPEFLAGLGTVMPLNAGANLLNHFIIGGQTVAVGAAVAVLLGWAVAGSILATVAASRRKQTSLAALRRQVATAAA